MKDYYYEITIQQKMKQIISELLSLPFSELNDYQLAALALAYAMKHNVKKANYFLKKVNGNINDIETKTMIFEARLITSIYKKQNSAEIENLANMILEFNPSAISARYWLAINDIVLKRNILGGINKLEEICVEWPENEWIYPQMIFALTWIKERKLALKFLPKINSRILLIVYAILLKVYYPYEYFIWIFLGIFLAVCDLLFFNNHYLLGIYFVFIIILRIIIGFWKYRNKLFSRVLAALYVIPVIIYFILKYFFVILEN